MKVTHGEQLCGKREDGTGEQGPVGEDLRPVLVRYFEREEERWCGQPQTQAAEEDLSPGGAFHTKHRQYCVHRCIVLGRRQKAK